MDNYCNNEIDDSLKKRHPPWRNELGENILFIFVHMPKSGGTSFNAYLEEIYGRYMVKYHPYFNPELFEETTLEKAKNILCISSHYGFGIHRLFGSDKLGRSCVVGDGLFSGRDIRYVTIVRNPLERMVSYYNFVTTFPLHHHYDKTKFMDIYQFFKYLRRKGDPELSNLQCYLLNGRLSRRFEDARYNIDKYFFAVATVDKFSQFVKSLKKEMCWPDNVQHTRRNISPKKVFYDEIDENLKEYILESNKEDFKLYKYVMGKNILI